MRKTIVFMMGLMLAACTADDSISRNYRCSFIFDTSLHPLPCQLTGILGNNGHFCKVEHRLVKGATHLKTTRNYDGAMEDIELGTAKESQISFALGANNCIIIRANLPAVFGVNRLNHILVFLIVLLQLSCRTSHRNARQAPR